jgi:hypothetical protein
VLSTMLRSEHARFRGVAARRGHTKPLQLKALSATIG